MEVDLQKAVENGCSRRTDSVYAVRGAVRVPPLRSWCRAGPRGVSFLDTNTEKWELFFRDPTFWWDNRLKKKNNLYSESFPDFKHVSTGDNLWIADRKTPTWVSAKLEALADPAVGKATTARYKSPHAPPEAHDNPVSLGRLIRDSAESRCLSLGKQAHEAVRKSDELKCNIYLLNGLIDMYSKCGEFEEARKIFDSMPRRDVVSYNAIIQGCGLNGQAELAFEYYSALRASTTVQPNDRTHVAVISACSKLATESSEARKRALLIGMEIHSVLSKEKSKLGLFVGNCLLDMYCKCGELEEARKVFDSMGTRRDVISYNSIIQGCGLNGQAQLALEYYSALKADTVVQPNDRTHAAVISACCECGELEEARKIFDSMPRRGIESHNAIIQGCGLNGQVELAFEYYSALRANTTIQPNDRSHVVVISACSRLATESSEARKRALRIGMEIHSMLREKNELGLIVANCLVDMYSKCGKLEEARKVFDSMGTRSVVSYTAIIQGCGLNGQAQLALEYYSAMKANTTMQPIDRTHVGNAVITACCKCGELDEARKVFDSMPRRDVVSYNAIINGCNLNAQAELALEYYHALRADSTVQPNACTYTCVLVACGSVMEIKIGREIHQLVKHKGLLKHTPGLASSLMTFYGKCGDVSSAQEVFDSCQARDTPLWNSLIQAYTLQGRSIQALECFYSMTREVGCKADDATFVAVLNACSHGGLVEKGRQLLDEMPKRYGVKPRLDHYGCLIDMLGRANQLDEAVKVLQKMPFEPDAVVWKSLLGACRKWNNYTVGKLAFERLVEMDPKNGVPYVLMANIFGNLGMLSERACVVERMRAEHSVRKAGRSWWTDSSTGIVHSFTVDDSNHSQSGERLQPS